MSRRSSCGLLRGSERGGPRTANFEGVGIMADFFFHVKKRVGSGVM